jgi:putative endonuclease
MFGWLRRMLGSSPLKAETFGNRGEAEAAKFLQGLGYQIVDRQLRSRYGEIDLIAIDGRAVVFIEVKTRSSTEAGHPTEAVTPLKQQKITRSALAFLKKQRWLNRSARFDVVSIVWPKPNESPRIDHYKNAFEPPGFGQLYS